MNVDGPPAWVDTVGISVPIRPGSEVYDGAPREGRKKSGGLRWQQSLPGGGVVRLGRPGRAAIEASLPKRALGHNITALTLDEALSSLRETFREAGEFFEPDRAEDGHRLEAARVCRLDLVRDFREVTGFARLLDAFIAMPRGRHRASLVRGGGRHGGDSMTVGPNSLRSILYDKHAETQGEAPPGFVRFEARFRRRKLESKWASDHGGLVRTVSDLREQTLRRLRWAAFKWLGFDRTVVSLAELEDIIFRRWSRSTAVRGSLWAYATAAPYRESIGDETARKRRKALSGLGVVPRSLSDLSVGGAVRLDYETGFACYQSSKDSQNGNGDRATTAPEHE